MQKIKRIAAAKQLHYYPNEMARSLVTSSLSNFIGVVVSDIKNPSYVDLITAMQKSIKKTPYNITLYDTAYNLDEEKRSIELMIRNRAIGAVIAAPVKNDENIKILIDENIPFVVWGTEVDIAEVDIVSVDNYGGARIAMEYLIKKGHKNIVHFSGPKNFGVAESRIQAYEDVMKENGLEVNSQNIIPTDVTWQSGYRKARKLENLEVMPTAIFAYCDYIALGILMYLFEKGYKVPDDISIIGFDDIEISRFNSIGLTTIRQPFGKIGKKIIEILEQRIKNPALKNDKEKIYFKPKIIERSTVKDIN